MLPAVREPNPVAIDPILVTESSGTIGTPLVEALLDRGYEVHGVGFTENRWSATVDDRSMEVDLRDPAARRGSG